MKVTAPLVALLSCLASLTTAAMSDQDCGEGRVRDLDGSCVKKVVISTGRPVCPKLSIDNGNIFLLGELGLIRKESSIFRLTKKDNQKFLIWILSMRRSLDEFRNDLF